MEIKKLSLKKITLTPLNAEEASNIQGGDGTSFTLFFCPQSCGACSQVCTTSPTGTGTCADCATDNCATADCTATGTCDYCSFTPGYC